MPEFCVECGAEGEIHDGLCKDCLIKKGGFVDIPETVDVTICAHCEKMLVGNHWEKERDVVSRAVEASIHVRKGVEIDPEISFERIDDRNYKAKVDIQIFIPSRDLELSETRELRVRVKQATCLECSRQRGHYYEAVVQLRAKGRKPTDEEMSEAQTNAENIAAQNHSFVTKVEMDKHGIDIYFGKARDGKVLSALIATRAGANTTETRTLSGRKAGVDLYRYTYLVRLPPFRRKDFVFMDGKIWEIRSFSKNRANLEDITNGTRVSRPTEEVEDLPLIKRDGALQEAIVVSDQGKELQVMHPESMKTVDISKPPGFKKGRKEIILVIYDGDLFPYTLGKEEE